MNKVFLLIAIFSSVSIVIAKAQPNFWNTSHAYLGQTPPSDTPEIFAPHLLVQDSGIAMDRSAFSADGKEFYYCKAMHWFSAKGDAIRYFRFDGGKWQGPVDLFAGYYAPTFSIDGQSLYMLGGQGDGQHSIVWVSHRIKDAWSKPELYLKKDYGLYDFMPTKNGIAYVGSNARQGNRKDYQTYDFCTLKFTSKDTLIESLGSAINTPGFDGDFYVAPDESFMIVSYKEKPDYECELGITFHKKDNSWTAPQNLGPLINDGNAHRWGEYVTPDNKFLFYSKGTSEKDCHIYWVRFDKLLDDLKHKELNR